MSDIIEYVKAFAVGGAFCVVAQILIDRTKLTPARILVGYVCGGVILGALGIYEPIVEFASYGATVPLSGFGSALAEGVRKAIGEEGLIGVLTGELTAAAGGISASLLCGVLASFIFKSRPK